ncbi:MAG: sigma-70 family RNA polymerase sigma factor [Chloroflexi bacterium]|nr:sigma-70 family RNA polymerase sigma factor [Chloroflexota bacterium]
MLNTSNDEELAARLGKGDADAFTVLYSRYFPQVYDLALRLLKDRGRAADVAQDTFLVLVEGKAWQTTPVSFRAWLYTVARHRAIDELRKAKRTGPLPDAESDEGVAAFSQIVDDSPGPEQVAQDKELAAMVWIAASSLSADKYELLDLHLRKGLTGEELAQVLKTTKGNAYTMLSRVRDSLEEAFAALVVARRGKKECPALAELLRAHTPQALSPRLRRQVTRHIRSCSSCQRTRRCYVSAAELFGCLAPVLPSASMQERVLAGLLQRLGTPPSPPGTSGAAPPPAAASGSGVAIGGVAKVVISAVAALGLLAGAAVGGMAAWGSAQVTIQNVGCAPVEMPVSGVLRAARLLPVVDIPDGAIAAGKSAVLRLPAGRMVVEVSRSMARVTALGLEFPFSFSSDLVRLEWDGRDLLGTATTVQLDKGSTHTLRLVCRRT